MAQDKHDKAGSDSTKTVKHPVPKALEFDSQIYAKGVGQSIGRWSSVIAAGLAGTATFFLRSKPQNIVDSATRGITTPVAMAVSSVVAWVGAGMIGRAVGKARGTKQANAFKSELYASMAETEGLKRENAILKESLANTQEQLLPKTRSFAEHHSSRAEHASHADAVRASQAEAAHEARVH